MNDDLLAIPVLDIDDDRSGVAVDIALITDMSVAVLAVRVRAMEIVLRERGGASSPFAGLRIFIHQDLIFFKSPLQIEQQSSIYMILEQ